jgi:hypothetical protein
LKPDADSPNFLELERGFLTNKFALVPRRNNPNSEFTQWHVPQGWRSLSLTLSCQMAGRCRRKPDITFAAVNVVSGADSHDCREGIPVARHREVSPPEGMLIYRYSAPKLDSLRPVHVRACGGNFCWSSLLPRAIMWEIRPDCLRGVRNRRFLLTLGETNAHVT